LIHAATMVNAGPFLLIRLSPLIILSPEAMIFIAIVGGTTALFAAMVSMAQSDIKKNLAYSTMSQIGFMIMLCGMGAFVAALFHLFAHGFLKAFLFLSTGNALQAVHDNHHAESSRLTHSKPHVFLYIGALVLACLPPSVIFSSPYEGLWVANGFASARIVFWVIGLATVFFTAIYLFRGILLLFQHGPTIHGAGNGMGLDVKPQLFSPPHIGVFVLVAGVMSYLLMSFWTSFVEFLTPVLPKFLSVETVVPITHVTGWWMLIPVGMAVCGWAYAVSSQATGHRKDLKEIVWKKALYVVFLHKGYFDECYDIFVVQPTLRFANWLWRVVDIGGFDRAIHSIASSSIIVANWLWRVIDIKGIDRAVVGLGGSSVGLGRWLWRVVDIRWIETNIGQVLQKADAAGHILQETESRTIQHQLLVMVFWLVAAIGLLYVLV